MEANVLHCGDNLEIMRGMDDGCIDLIATDPPYNLGREVENGGIFSDCPEGVSYQDKSEYKRPCNSWDNVCPEWHKRNKGNEFYFLHHFCSPSELYYFEEMIPTLIELKRVLKRKGMLYWQCDWRTNHIYRIVLNHIFKDRACFKNEIVWYYPNKCPIPSLKKRFSNNYDTILFYSGDQRNSEPIHLERENGTKKKMGTVWSIPFVQGKERLDYPTQKPVALYERMIKASSNQGDVVLDPFCGSGTTLDAAHTLGRQWIGIDQSQQAIDTVIKRMRHRHSLEYDRDYQIRKNG